MEGFSIIYYKGKPIYYFDYSEMGNSKEKVTELVKYASLEYQKMLPDSVLVLVNVANLHLDSDLVNVFRFERERTNPYEKRVAVFGAKGMQKIAYNFVSSFGKKPFVKAFDTELEAKEWLVNNE